MKKLRSTRSHFKHARSCLCALKRAPTRAKRQAFHPDVFFCEKEIVFLSIVLRITRKVTKINLWESLTVRISINVLQRSIFSSLLSLILIHLADACILVMACVDCARVCSQKPFLASLSNHLHTCYVAFPLWPQGMSLHTY